MTNDHEHVYVEEQEPSGRLILPPCLICELTAMDAIEQLRIERYEEKEATASERDVSAMLEITVRQLEAANKKLRHTLMRGAYDTYESESVRDWCRRRLHELSRAAT